MFCFSVDVCLDPTEVPASSGALFCWLGGLIGVGPAVDGLGLNGMVGGFDLGTLFLQRVTGSQSSPSGERTEPLHGEESPWGDRILSFFGGGI